MSLPNLSGRKVLLHWSSQSERNHIIIGNSDEQVYSIYRSILLSNKPGWCDSTPLGLIDVDIVSPPKDLQLRWAKATLEDDKQSFFWYLQSACENLAPDLPDGVRACPEIGLPPDKELSPLVESHYACKICDGAGIMVDDLDAMYAKYQDKWFQETAPAVPATRASKAPLPDAKKQLFAACYMDGCELIPQDQIVGRHVCVHFFYHCLGQRAIAQNVLQLHRQRQQALHQEAEMLNQQYQERAALQTLEKIRKYREFFNMPDLDMLLERHEKEVTISENKREC